MKPRGLSEDIASAGNQSVPRILGPFDDLVGEQRFECGLKIAISELQFFPKVVRFPPGSHRG